MATDVLADGNTRVTFVPDTPGIADKAAPTVTEMEAGVDLQWQITKDGLVGFEVGTAEVDNGALASKFDTNDTGRGSLSGTLLRLKRQKPDVAYDTLKRGVAGYIVIRRDIPEEMPYAADQDVSVFPVRCGFRRDLPPEDNSTRKYEIPTMVYRDPELDAVVAAGD